MVTTATRKMMVTLRRNGRKEGGRGVVHDWCKFGDAMEARFADDSESWRLDERKQVEGMGAGKDPEGGSAWWCWWVLDRL